MRRIQNSEGQWLEDDATMTEEAMKFFQAQFHEDKVPINFDIIKHVPDNMITT